MSSLAKDVFFFMTCDVLKMSGKAPEIKDKLAIRVIGTSKASKPDFTNSLGI